jgi:hypothetical protein
MAIGNKQIGWSEKANLLWEISKQLDKLLCVNTVCQTSTSSTTTTTTTINCHCYTIVNNSGSDSTYSYVDCLGNVENDILITAGQFVNICAIFGSIVFIDGLIIDNGVCLEVCNYSCSYYKVVAPERPENTTWYYSYLNCDGTFVLNSMRNNDEFTECMVTGSLTYDPEGLIVTDLGDCIVESTNRFVECGLVDECTEACAEPFNYYTVYMTQNCIDNWPSIGCEVWLDATKTTPFPDGGYSNGIGSGCIVITGGIITNII